MRPCRGAAVCDGRACVWALWRVLTAAAPAGPQRSTMVERQGAPTFGWAAPPPHPAGPQRSTMVERQGADTSCPRDRAARGPTKWAAPMSSQAGPTHVPWGPYRAPPQHAYGVPQRGPLGTPPAGPQRSTMVERQGRGGPRRGRRAARAVPTGRKRRDTYVSPVVCRVRDLRAVRPTRRAPNGAAPRRGAAACA